ncbi:hypothetical protein BVAVS116_A0061 (plasmid) [Borreliella valaisiana VS116]|uniref:Uncharacterized protein n=1 Tax=Borreliella valaisiana VS116 TaxID=445987 RepID=C0R8A2_BORVA|nr:hypothetical protein BVAVS116_A0061 [Borreliella valaisiana VS116]
MKGVPGIKGLNLTKLKQKPKACNKYLILLISNIIYIIYNIYII